MVTIERALEALLRLQVLQARLTVADYLKDREDINARVKALGRVADEAERLANAMGRES